LDVKTVQDAINFGKKLANESEHLSSGAVLALLSYVIRRDKAWIIAHNDEQLPPGSAEQFIELAQRAAGGAPLAYLSGERDFHGLMFAVTPDVLIPRPETEELVDYILNWVQGRESLRIIDVGTGSGAIAITLAVKLPDAVITGSDISPQALQIASDNAARHRVYERVRFAESDLLSDVEGPFDVIAANLPYIASDVLPNLEVDKWEPRLALDGGEDGLEFVRMLVQQAKLKIASGGLLILEIGHDQGQVVSQLCKDVFRDAEVEVLKDLAGKDRLVKVQV